jgi:hypothetical protein
VLVYRLITAGTVEEKIYEKQIYKDGIRRTVFTECATIQRYFDRHELRRLFKLSEPGVCSVLEMIRRETEHLNINWDRHSFVTRHPSVVGMSPHDGLYLDEQSQENDDATDLPPATPFAKMKSTPSDRSQDSAGLDLVPLECTPPPRTGKSGQNGRASGSRTRLGRAQRILAGRTNIAVPLGKTGGATTDHRLRKSSDSCGGGGGECFVVKDSSRLRPPFPVPRRAPSSAEFLDGASTETEEEDAECFAYADTETEAPDASAKENANDDSRSANPQDQTASVQLHRARDLHREGMPRRSLQLLLDVLHSQDKYRQLDRHEKALLHKSISDAAATTGLL